MKKGSAEGMVKSKKDQYEIVSQFPNTDLMVVRHLLCGCKFEVHKRLFDKGEEKCSICSNGKFITRKEFIEKTRVNLKDFDMLDYQNIEAPARFIHSKCGFTTVRTPEAFVNDNSCDYCDGDYFHLMDGDSYANEL